MDHLSGGGGAVLDRQKDSVVLGTYESSAFILSLRDADEFSTIHSFGYHRIPHIGVYGKEYTISVPMVLLSLPTTQRTLKRLPRDLLGALDLDHLLTPTQTPRNPPQPLQNSPQSPPNPPQPLQNSPQSPRNLPQPATVSCMPSPAVENSPPMYMYTESQELLRENILTFIRVFSSSGLSPERIVAKALVDYVLHSAQKRLAPPTLSLRFGVDAQNTGPSLNTKCNLLSINTGIAANGVVELRQNNSRGIMGLKDGGGGNHSMRWSASGMSMDSEGYGSASTDYSDMPRNERRRISFTVGVDGLEKEGEELGELVDEEELRVVAKKLVMKILHMACKEVESLNRRSSIEYLIASTKRMRIDDKSPSPPPILFNIAEEQDGVETNDRPNPFSEFRPPGPSERSPTPEHLLRRRLGKKRGRSGSHEVSALREFIETSRRSKVVRKIISLKEKIVGGGGVQQLSPGRASSSVRSPTRSNEDSSSQSEDEATSYTSLVSNMSRMSIDPRLYESDTESEPTSYYSDESFTILNAVTVSEDPLAGLREEGSASPSTTGKRLPFQDVHRHSPSHHHHQRGSHLGLTGGGVLPSSPLHVSSSAHNVNMRTPQVTQYRNTPRGNTQDSVVSDMDLYVIVHSRPSPGKCQKFLCNNMNEINLMYHCWMYPDVPFDPGMSVSEKLLMGVFEPSFVDPVHLDLHDAGVAFYFLDERTVCIHSCCFSPENAQLQLTPIPENNSSAVHSFYSAASLRSGKRVAAFHIIPPSLQAEQRIRESLRNCSSLRQLLGRLKETFPEVGHEVLNLVMPQ